MSLTTLFRDGFAWITTSTSAPATPTPKWTGVTATFNAGTNYGRYGGVGLAAAGSGSAVYVALTPSTTPGGMCGCFIPNTPTGTVRIMQFLDATGVVLCTLNWNTDGSLSVTNGSGLVLGTSAAGLVNAGETHHFGWQIFVSGTVGTVDVWLDGNAVSGLSGITGENTRGASTATTCSRWAISAPGGSLATAQTNTRWQDVVFYDASSRTTGEHYGDKKVQCRLANGNGTGDVGTWTQTGGTGGQPWSAVSESPPDNDASYLADGTPGDIKTFTVPALDAGTTGVVDVAVTAIWEKDDTASRTGACVIRGSSTTVAGSAVAASGSYAALQQTFTTAPGGGAWSPSNANVEIGFKVVS